MAKTIVISIIVMTLVGIAFGGFYLLNRSGTNPLEVVVQNTPAVVASPSPSLSPEQIVAITDQQTKEDIGKIAFALQSYYVNHATYPSKAQGIAHLVLDKRLVEVPKPFSGSFSYSYFVDPYGCKGDESNPCKDVYVLGTLLSKNLNNEWCWDSKSGKAREVATIAMCKP